MPQPVRELVPEACVGDDASRRGVDLRYVDTGFQRLTAGPLGCLDQCVKVFLPGRWWPSYDHRTGHVGVVAGIPRAEVNLEELPRSYGAVGGTVMWDCRVWSAAHDGGEGDRLSAVGVHQAFELSRYGQFCTPRLQSLDQVGECPISNGAGLLQQLDLCFVLCLAQSLDYVTEGQELEGGCERLQRCVILNSHVVRLERQPAETVRLCSADQRRGARLVD